MKTRFCFAILSLSGIFLCICKPAQAAIVGISWEANLNVSPGMEGELPPGVINGQKVYGSFLYETDWGCSSGSPDGNLKDYHTYSWFMNLGDDNTFSRRYDDNFTGLGLGSMQIRNNDSVYHDRLSFDISLHPYDMAYNVNEYYFRFTIEDFDSSVWNTANEPESFNFGEFEIVSLEIRRIKLGTPGCSIAVARMDGLDEVNPAQIPEPGSLLLFAAGCSVLLNKRRILS